MKMTDIKVDTDYAYAFGSSDDRTPSCVRVTKVNVPILDVRGHWSGNITTDTGRKGVEVRWQGGRTETVRPATLVRTWAEEEERQREFAAAADTERRRLSEKRRRGAEFVRRLHDRMVEAGVPSQNATVYRDEIHAALSAAGIPKGSTASAFHTPVPHPDDLVEDGCARFSTATLAALLGIADVED